MEEEQSDRPPKKMLKAEEGTGSGSHEIEASIEDLGNDLMLNILSRLPAPSFAAAACVSRSWSSLCHRVLSVPKLSSAVSFNPVLEVPSSFASFLWIVIDDSLNVIFRCHFLELVNVILFVDWVWFEDNRTVEVILHCSLFDSYELWQTGEFAFGI